MKTKTVLIYLALFFQASFLISCEKRTALFIGIDLKPLIEIYEGDFIIVNLGNFGDEEGASILTEPKHAKKSYLERDTDSNAIYYNYCSVDHFVGKDSVTLILNHGSYGSGLGINDTTTIHIVVRKF